MAPPAVPTPPRDRLDLQAILVAAAGQFTPWLVAVLLVTWAGYPGIVCVTPVAWLLALRVGITCVSRSNSAQATRRLQEAGLAGALFGLLQATLFWVIVPRMGPIQPGEQTSAMLINIAMLLLGMLVAAGLSLFTASQAERRREAQEIQE